MYLLKLQQTEQMWTPCKADAIAPLLVFLS